MFKRSRLPHAFVCVFVGVLGIMSAPLSARADENVRPTATATAADAAQARVQGFAADVLRARDAQGRPFAVLDKSAAMLWVFDAQGRLLARTFALVGQAEGDVAPPDIGVRPLSKVRPAEKITSAGRFETTSGVNTHGEDIVWLDYSQALSMHRVRDVRGEARLARIRNPDPRVRRITFGCVNLPAPFYNRYINPLFARKPGVVYVLPEVLPLGQVFGFVRGASGVLP